MRKLILTLLFTLFSLMGFAQLATTFNDTLKPFGVGAYANRVVCEDDSFFYIGGVYKSTVIGAKNQIFIAKFNKDGTLLKQKIFKDTSKTYHVDSYTSMILDSNKLLICFLTEQIPYEVKGGVVAINKFSLDTLWKNHYQHPDTASISSPPDRFSDLTAIKKTVDGNYILSGNYMTNGNSRSYIMKIDSIGNQLWTQVYNDVANVYDIELGEDKGYTFLNNLGYQVNKIVFTDSLGNIVRHSSISTGSNGYSYASSIALDHNQDYVGIDTYLHVDNPDYRFGLNVYKYDYVNDQVIWDRKYILYKSIECITTFPAIGVETLPDGKIIVSGTLSLNSGYRKGFVLKLNENGDSLWTRTYDLADQSSHHSQINDLMPTSDGGYMGVGFIRDINGDHTAWMFKTDSNGLITDLDSPNLPKTQVQVDCYPNPAQSQLTLEWHSPTPQKGILEVYNPLGSLILREEIRSGKHKLNLHNWQTGVYLYRLVLDGEVLGAGKFVKKVD